nr:MAG TPA: hypothetical protein [Caudoviricetes sp.]
MTINLYMCMIRYESNGSLTLMVNGKYSAVSLNLQRTLQVLVLVN